MRVGDGLLFNTPRVKAAREQRALDPVDLFDLSAALLGAAYNVAMLAGENHRAGYAEIVRRHAEAISGGAAEN